MSKHDEKDFDVINAMIAERKKQEERKEQDGRDVRDNKLEKDPEKDRFGIESREDSENGNTDAQAEKERLDKQTEKQRLHKEEEKSLESIRKQFEVPGEVDPNNNDGPPADNNPATNSAKRGWARKIKDVLYGSANFIIKVVKGAKDFVVNVIKKHPLKVFGTGALFISLLSGGLRFFNDGFYDSYLKKRAQQSRKGYKELSPHARVVRKIKDDPENLDVDHSADEEKISSDLERGMDGVGIPKTIDNISALLAILRGESGFHSEPRKLRGFPYSEGSDADTLGPMQVHKKRVMERRGVDEDEATRILTIPDEAMKVGLEIFRDILDMYPPSETDPDSRWECVFADYNAGPHHCWNAGLQTSMFEYLGEDYQIDKDTKVGDLKADGDLREVAIKLIKAVAERALTDEEAQTNGETLTDEEIRSDLMLKETKEFRNTKTWRIVSGACEAKNKKKIIPVVPNAEVSWGVWAVKNINHDDDTGTINYTKARMNDFRKIRRSFSEIP